jgi:hypothetical protein
LLCQLRGFGFITRILAGGDSSSAIRDFRRELGPVNDLKRAVRPGVAN